MTFDDAMQLQAQFCDATGAPITARVCRALANTIDPGSITGRRVLAWADDPIQDALPLRLAAPLHALHRSGRDTRLAALFQNQPADDVGILKAVIAEHDAWINSWLDSPPQTNELARSAAFMAALLEMASRFGLPFELMEIGSSAGLSLLIDRLHYRLGDAETGTLDSPITVSPDWRGVSPPQAPVTITSVRGVDIAPIDVTQPEGAERLQAYVWADIPERAARLEKAIAMVRERPVALEQGDAADWVEAQLAKPAPADACRVLMHSVMWQYMPPKTQARITKAMEQAGQQATAQSPLAWIAFESERTGAPHTVTLRLWPQHPASLLLGHAHPHASWVDWQGWG